MLKPSLIPIFLFFMAPCFAQQNNIWYYGNKAGVNFNTLKPTALHNSAMDANEGSSIICDSTGKLLFYTNGSTVYNKNHQVLSNGTGLSGNLSSVQSALIVPVPGGSNIFYIFTSDAVENNFDKGYNYSIVDMSLDNGLGQVTIKNAQLSASGTERLTAAHHADGSRVWVITNDFNSNRFSAWLVDCEGLNSTPVVSTVGQVLNSTVLMNTGMMKVSPDGKQLCQTHFPFGDDFAGTNFVQLFDFDNNTGIISNAKTIALPGANFNVCEFSSNSQLLYLLRTYEKKLNQLECKLPTVPLIIASAVTINTNVSFYGIQLAPDQKIYLSLQDIFLAAIKSPNIKGAGCNFQQEYFDINENISGQGSLGFPNFINDMSFDGSHGFNYTISDSCSGAIQFHGFTSIAGPVSWFWDFGDGATSTLQHPVHNFSSAFQQYKVKIKIQSANACGLPLERTQVIIPTGLILDPSFDFKVVCDSGYARFSNKSVIFPDTASVQYLWDFGDGNFSNQVSPVHNYAGGNYTVRLTIKTTTPCLDRVITVPLVMESIQIQASPDVQIDQGQSTVITATGPAVKFSWTPSAGLSNPRIANPIANPRRSTMYVVTGFSTNGCTAKDSVLVQVREIPGIHVPSAFTPNNDGKNDVFRPTISDNLFLDEFSVYNRWGQVLFTTSVKDFGWNGKLNGVMQNAGVYVWVVVATDMTIKNKVEVKGTFIIMR